MSTSWLSIFKKIFSPAVRETAPLSHLFQNGKGGPEFLQILRHLMMYLLSSYDRLKALTLAFK
jgi:hypothetical protein